MNTLDPEFLDRVDRYWADFLGCAPDMLRRETPQVVGHAALDDYAGCYLMEFGGAPIVSLPIDEVESYRQAVAQWRPGIVRTPAVVEAVFGKGVTGSIGPAFVGYSDLKHFRPVPAGAARPLTARDEKAVDTLRAACVIEDWNHGGNQFRPSAMVGAFIGDELAALASYQLWDEQIAHIAIVAHPAFRRHGYATVAVSRLTEMVFERALVPQYRTLESNAPSMAVARRLGFVRYATSLAVRLVSSK
jgi:GNAT superfamily N-acetyltransferase